MIDIKKIDINKISFDKSYVGQFRREFFEELLTKVNNPIIFIGKETALNCISEIETNLKSVLSYDLLITALLSGGGLKELVLETIQENKRFYFDDNTYRFDSYKVPFVFDNSIKEKIYIINQEDYRDAALFHIL